MSCKAAAISVFVVLDPPGPWIPMGVDEELLVTGPPCRQWWQRRHKGPEALAANTHRSMRRKKQRRTGDKLQIPGQQRSKDNERSKEKASLACS